MKAATSQPSPRWQNAASRMAQKQQAAVSWGRASVGRHNRQTLGIDEPLDALVGRSADQLVERPVLHDSAVAEQDQTIAEEAGLTHIVRDHHDRLAERLK